MEIIDNFLAKDLFDKIQNDVFDQDTTPWFCIKDISGEGIEKLSLIHISEPTRPY